MKNSQLSDDEFTAAFEAATLADFHHADHIRAAWIYLRRIPFPAASERMAESLRHYAASKGAHMKYHETITQAWMLLVASALEQDGQAANATDGFNAFAEAHPELLDMHALDRFYSSQLLASPAARAHFVSPDIAPLPDRRKTSGREAQFPWHN
jgi:hypothetical protein